MCCAGRVDLRGVELVLGHDYGDRDAALGVGVDESAEVAGVGVQDLVGEDKAVGALGDLVVQVEAIVEPRLLAQGVRGGAGGGLYCLLYLWKT